MMKLVSDKSPHIELIGRLHSLLATMKKLRGDQGRVAEFESAIESFQSTAADLQDICIHQAHVPEALRRLRELKNATCIAQITPIYGSVDKAIETIQDSVDRK